MGKNKADKLIEQINDLRKQLYEHQAKCKHPRGTKEYGYRQDGWCEQDDMYWVDIQCGVCYKRWSADKHSKDDKSYHTYMNDERFIRI